MYAALWRALPGGTAARVVQVLVLLVLAVAVLFQWVFPLLADWLAVDDATLG
ncbi:hypothetical protein [Ornithinicoccus halotolerans]|uniref:hypothetical protein n=1 Tax=Ornithinicoccus halotolerans TaxID=1748220 RepID=UPI001885ADF5|nr:hypothetical protein [Ornithinicoccus halotolerans]